MTLSGSIAKLTSEIKYELTLTLLPTLDCLMHRGRACFLIGNTLHSKIADGAANKSQWQLVFALTHGVFAVRSKSVPSSISIIVQYVVST